MTTQAIVRFAWSFCLLSMLVGWVRANHKPNSVPVSPFDHTDRNHLSRTLFVQERLEAKRPEKRDHALNAAAARQDRTFRCG
jgi:hypothetical protein